MIQLIHWDAKEGKRLAKRFGLTFEPPPSRKAGTLPTPVFLRRLRAYPPDAFVIDLSRIPSQGRDLAMWLRRTKTTRHVPLIFVEGDPAKVSAIRKLLPDAQYGSWKQIRALVRKAKPLKTPVVPESAMAGYSATPLPKKLGIKPGVKVGLLDAPGSAMKLLGDFEEADPDSCDLALWWVRSCHELQSGIRGIAAPRLWIFWPKVASGVKTDLTQQVIRETGLATGWVDYKICAFDKTWSGLLFSRRPVR